jgi:hypothetical protein
MVTTNQLANTADIRRFYQLITSPGEVREIRGLKTTAGVATAVCDNADAFVQSAATLSGKAAGVYATGNPIPRSLMARAPNQIKYHATVTTTDADPERRTLIYHDCDAGQPPGQSSTDAERDAALAMRDREYDYLVSMGAPPDSFIKVMTGNGGGLYQRIDLPNDTEAKDLLKRYLEALDVLFGEGEHGPHIDVGVFNAARIVKIPGTMACKGQNTPERPHRLATIDSAPAKLEPTPRSVIEAVALPKAPPAPVRTYTGNGHIELKDWVGKNSIPIKQVKQTADGELFVFAVCQWNPAHNHGQAWARQFKNGAIAAGCLDTGCIGKDWHDLRRIVEPDFDKRADLTRYAASMTEREPQDPLHCTDAGNALRLLSAHGKDMKYCRLEKDWYTFNGKFWPRGIDRVFDYAKEVPRMILAEASRETDKESRERLAKWALSTESMQRITAMMAYCESDELVRITPDQFDTGRLLLNCNNGTMNLETGILQPHDRADLITRCIATDYRPEVNRKIWHDFLETVIPDAASR